MIVVLPFLFKGESFSFVRGLWLLDLNNRKIFPWIFSESALHLMFSNGDWIVFCFLELWKFMWDLYFFRYHCFVYRREFWLEHFCRGTSTRLVIFALDQGVFISFIVIYDYFVLLSCSICFLCLYWKIWYCWCLLMQDRGCFGGLELAYAIEITWIFQNWSG